MRDVGPVVVDTGRPSLGPLLRLARDVSATKLLPSPVEAERELRERERELRERERELREAAERRVAALEEQLKRR
jgi:hypothetical protein